MRMPFYRHHVVSDLLESQTNFSCEHVEQSDFSAKANQKAIIFTTLSAFPLSDFIAVEAHVIAIRGSRLNAFPLAQSLDSLTGKIAFTDFVHKISKRFLLGKSRCGEAPPQTYNHS